MQEPTPAATTSYPCLLSHLGDSEGADRMSPAAANVRTFLEFQILWREFYLEFEILLIGVRI